MPMRRVADTLVRVDACEPAMVWIRGLPTGTTPKQAWGLCSRGDWMLWLLMLCVDRMRSDAHRQLVLCACECARLSLTHVPPGDVRPRIGIALTERWAMGEDVDKDAISAAYSDALDAYLAAAAAAYACASAYYVAACVVASYLTAGAAHIVSTCATYASGAASYASYSAAAANPADPSARYSTLRRCSDIVRHHYPSPPDLSRHDAA